MTHRTKFKLTTLLILSFTVMGSSIAGNPVTIKQCKQAFNSTLAAGSCSISQPNKGGVSIFSGKCHILVKCKTKKQKIILGKCTLTLAQLIQNPEGITNENGCITFKGCNCNRP